MSILVNETARVSGLMQHPRDAHACMVLAHGAGAGMDHPFMVQIAQDLAARGVATLRHQFLGFPLHAPNRPSSVRGEHLMQVSIPMLFLQGTRDALADLRLLQGLVKRLDELATLRVLADADHSFHVLVRSGRTDAQVRGEMLESLVSWIASVIWMIGNWADEDHAGKLRWQRIDPYTRACSKTLYLHLVNGGRRAVAAGPHLGLPGP